MPVPALPSLLKLASLHSAVEQYEPTDPRVVFVMMLTIHLFFPLMVHKGERIGLETCVHCMISPLASEDNGDACHVSEDCRRIVE